MSAVQPRTRNVITSATHTNRIGPNALIQTVRALREQLGNVQANQLLQQGGQGYLIDHQPTAMVDEKAFMDLVAALVSALGVAQTKQVLARSGQLTALYLLQHRIPQSFQRLLKLLPRHLALALLLFAISKHAWTFVGSGAFRYRLGRTTALTVHSSIQPVAAVHGFYGGTFEHLVHALIDAQAEMQYRAPTLADTSDLYQIGSQPDLLAECNYFISFH